MQPFNLTRALAGEKVITRAGWDVRYLSYNPENNKVVAWVYGGPDFLPRCSVFDGTTGLMFDRHSSQEDLFMAPKTREAWINVYPLNVPCPAYPTKEIADEKASATRLYCVRVEWQEP